MPVTSSSPSIYTLLEVMSMGKTIKLTYEYIKAEFEKEGFTLLSTEYSNSYTKLSYICPKGHTHNMSWDSFKQGNRCPSPRLTIEFIKAEFEKENYALLSTKYKHAHDKLEYICDKGHRHSITWSNWNHPKKYRCPTCYNIKSKGMGSYLYKGGVTQLKIPLYETYAPQLEKYQSVYKIKQDDLELLGVRCKYCEKIFIPKNKQVMARVKVINGKGKGDSHLYCSEECKIACPTHNQKIWPKDYKP